MFLRLFFTLFVVSSGFCANVRIDNKVIQDLFANTQAAELSPAFNNGPLGSSNNGSLLDPDCTEDEYTHVAADYDRFDWTLTKRVAASSKNSFLISPLGIKLALTVLYEAGAGATQSELSSVLGFEIDRSVVRKKFSRILESLKKQSSHYMLKLGSRLYVEDSVQPTQRFSAIAEGIYNTELSRVNFNNPVVAAREINTWISDVTQGKIPNLVNEDDVTDLAMLLLNALYFKGTWRHQFPPNVTKLATFYVSPTVQKQIQFMNVQKTFYYAESAQYDAKILRMPYLGKKFSMYIIVPNSLTGLPLVFNKLSDVRAEMQRLQEYLVDVTLPKFQFDFTSSLNGILKEMGIRTAFEDTASFSGIARGQLLEQRLKVSKILQRAGIEVNEHGGVAYSATEVAVVNKVGDDTDSMAEVIANKPFLFFIQDDTTGQLLFTGRVSDPSQLDGASKLP